MNNNEIDYGFDSKGFNNDSKSVLKQKPPNSKSFSSELDGGSFSPKIKGTKVVNSNEKPSPSQFKNGKVSHLIFKFI